MNPTCVKAWWLERGWPNGGNNLGIQHGWKPECETQDIV